MNWWNLLKVGPLRTSMTVYYCSAPHKKSVRSNKMAVVKIAHCIDSLQSFHAAALSSEAAPYVLLHNLMLVR